MATQNASRDEDPQMGQLISGWPHHCYRTLRAKVHKGIFSTHFKTRVERDEKKSLVDVHLPSKNTACLGSVMSTKSRAASHGHCPAAASRTKAYKSPPSLPISRGCKNPSSIYTHTSCCSASDESAFFFCFLTPQEVCAATQLYTNTAITRIHYNKGHPHLNLDPHYG